MTSVNNDRQRLIAISFLKPNQSGRCLRESIHYTNRSVEWGIGATLGRLTIGPQVGNLPHKQLTHFCTGLYAMQSISTFSPGIANWHATVVRAGLSTPKNSA